MSLYLLHIKSYFFATFIVIACCVSVNAQDEAIMNYLRHTGDYAEIYNGEVESVYNVLQYSSFPYYMSPDFTNASIVYKNNSYPNQKVRLDLFKEQLILVLPEKQFAIIVNSKDVDSVHMYNRTFVRLDPPKKSGLRQGFYIQLMDSEKIQVYRKDHFNIDRRKQKYTFELKTQYYLLYEDRYYTVKNKNSFSKIFTQHKKQIDKFAKENKLNFEQYKDESLISLAAYCEELITSTNK